ncbi:hypothetical protein BJY01DRAFT_248330 [Aspergillus pseudoustus]|uniref:BZIP domain-containing protein n=1 Tax=Aspergillus pseudoustus TaxID=1810923 RepID=A0ABR4JVL6_9EURO
MEYHQSHSTLRSPTATHALPPFLSEVDYPSLPLDLICGLDNFTVFHGHSQRTDILASSATASPESSRTSSPSPSDSGISRDPSERKAARRRAQNREAQRRFRERKEQQKKVLQKDADALRKDYQALLKQYADAASDVTRLVKENDVLRFEVRNLRQQWRLVLGVLQRLPSVQGQSPSPGGVLPEDIAFAFDDNQGYLEDLASGALPNMMRYLR